MKTYNILAIGNSFSMDACRYLYQTAKAAGISTKVVNLYIGGCPLERHWENIEKNTKAYEYQLNGVCDEHRVSIDEMLETENWDYITLQQASHDSGWINSYEPFLGLLLEHLRSKTPKAKILLHETWAYDPDSTHERFPRYHRCQQEMYDCLHHCYSEMAEKYGLELIPCGTVIQNLRALPEFDLAAGGKSLCRDGFHMSYDYGRYVLACTWVKKLFSVSVKDNSFVPDDPFLPNTPDGKLLDIIRQTVEETVK